MSETAVYRIPTRQDTVIAADVERDFAKLRAYGKLSRAMFPFGGEGWIATRYDDVKTVLMDPRFSLEKVANGDNPRIRYVESGEPFPPSFANMDPPAHGARRSLLMKYLTVKRIRELRPKMEAIAETKLDEIIRRGAPGDLAQDYAKSIPVEAICALVGAPVEDQDRFLNAAFMISNSLVNTQEEANHYVGILREYFMELAQRKQADPGDDILSAMLGDPEVTDSWPMEELEGIGVILLMAGHDSTASVLGGIINWLVHDADTYANLRANPQRIAKAIEEFLRFLPAGYSGTRGRIALEDVQVGDVLVKAGEVVLPVVHAANMDEAAFKDADDVVLDHGARAHVAFGYGIHSCVGAHLARMEMDVALQALLNRFASLSPVEADPDWRERTYIRGPKHIMVNWTLA